MKLFRLKELYPWKFISFRVHNSYQTAVRVYNSYQTAVTVLISCHNFKYSVILFGVQWQQINLCIASSDRVNELTFDMWFEWESCDTIGFSVFSGPSRTPLIPVGFR